MTHASWVLSIARLSIFTSLRRHTSSYAAKMAERYALKSSEASYSAF
jgi:hypothetical protein